MEKSSVALSKDRDDWLRHMKNENFLDVLDYDLHLECPGDTAYPEIADISVPMGTMLQVGEEKDGGYSVLVPQRDQNGNADWEEVRIPASAQVSRGYIPYTEENVRILADRHVGHAYLSADMTDAFDCSGMTRSIYSCFGYILPRSAVSQSKVEAAKKYNVKNDLGLGFTLNVGSNTTSYKLKVLENAPVGTLLYFPGHIMLYLGMENGKPMCVSSVGDYSTKDVPAGTIIQVNETVVTDMTYVTRASGKTWLEALERIVIIE